LLGVLQEKAKKGETKMTEGTKTETDYFGRLNRLTEAESKEWLRLSEGKHTIEFLSEGTPFTQEWENNGRTELVRKLRFVVRNMADGKEYSFSVTEGLTKASLYGQLLLVATKIEPINQLKGKKVTILVTGNDKKKRYTVLEAVDLQKDTPLVEKEVQMNAP